MPMLVAPLKMLSSRYSNTAGVPAGAGVGTLAKGGFLVLRQLQRGHPIALGLIENTRKEWINAHYFGREVFFDFQTVTQDGNALIKSQLFEIAAKHTKTQLRQQLSKNNARTNGSSRTLKKLEKSNDV